MVKENLKRKKKHDRDKYYHLAKEQGYRSRAAFKLIQINRKYDFLSRAKVCIDLCAAPGGWCQVAAKHMPAESIILGVDLLPIRPIPKVKTLVQDITTSECRTLIKKEMRSHHADVVLCDGAPNVGAAYDKDAFVQNEIALAALRVATHHLGPGGTFLTKVYRSSDYNALMWVFNQLFGSVQAIKPSSSRQQSAEIFVLCLKYKAPHSIDPKLLDPQFVFQEMEDTGKSAINIFSTQYEKQKRHRTGYEDAGVLLHKKTTVSAFVDSDDPVQMLTVHNQISFEPGCKPYAEHALTTEEIKSCLEDLKILGKGDFKALLKWRLKMREYRDSMLEAGKKKSDDDEKKKKEEAEQEKKPLTAQEEEDEIQAEIRKLQEAKAAKTKREKKKERERLAKLRVRQAYGMHHDAFDLPEHESIFSLKTIADSKDLETIRRGDFAEVGDNDDPDMGGAGQERDEEEEGSDDEEARAARLEAELEESYHQYLSNKSDERLKGTKAGKRKKATLAALAAEKTSEDMAMYDGDMNGYIQMLTGKRKDEEDSDTESDEDSEEEEEVGGQAMDMSDEEEPHGTDGDDDDDDEEDADDEDEEDDIAGSSKKKKHPLLIDPAVFAGVEKGGAKVARWFSNPLFKNLGANLEADDDDEEEEEEEEKPRSKKQLTKGGGKKRQQEASDEESEEEEEVAPSKSKSSKNGKAGAASKSSVVDDVLASMPKTDKQLRHEKRVKGMERRERKAAKRQRMADPDGEEDDQVELVDADPEKAEKAKKRQAIIKAGMGAALDKNGPDGFEVVPADGSTPLPIMDDRKNDSENEQWDDEERAKTLAIATMMLRRSKAKELVDASYNRFAWNDAGDLPEWFVDDEEKHFRPQIPIPKPLLDEMKERFKTLASKPIAKVAEARARKRKRAVQRLKQAKAKASAIVANPDMTERDKMKAIQKAIKNRGGDFSRPDKVYAVVRKGGSSTASKKGEGSSRARVKLVDKRMKKDTRGMKKKKGGKGGGGKKKGGKGKRAR